MKLTKKMQKEAVRAILYAYPLNQQVTELNHLEHLMGVFSRHPEWAIKEGVGVRRITIRESEYKNRCFYLERMDGTTTDISFIQCIDGKSSRLSDVRCACRSAIRPVVKQFRTDHVTYGQTTCPITGEVLTEDNTHIDHYDAPFQEVFMQWLVNYDLDWLFNQISDMSVDNETGIYFTNASLVAGFVSFHNGRTHLRAVSKQANLSLLRYK